MYRLAFTTINVQISIGYVGIRYLRESQSRKLALTSLQPNKDNPKAAAHAYVKRVLRFIVFVGIPYMAQRTALENVETLALGRFTASLHNHIRLEWPFAQDGVHIAAIQSDGKHSPGGY
jgi:hypothetical protein